MSTAQAEYDMPPWLQALIDQRMSRLKDEFLHLLIEAEVNGQLTGQSTAVVTQLVAPKPSASQAEVQFLERSCDCCRKFCNEDTEFFTGTAEGTLGSFVNVTLVFGVCAQCKTTIG